MKFNFKKLFIVGLVAINFVPLLVSAKETEKKNPPEQASVNGDFCAKIENLQKKYADQIIAVQEKAYNNEIDKENKLIKKESDLDAIKASNRAEIDAKRLDNWNKISSKAKNIRERILIEAYKKAVGSAVLVQRTSIDSAIKTYRDGVVLILDNYSKTVDQAIQTFKTSVDATLSKSQNDCNLKVAGKDVRDNFNKSVNEARRVLETSHQKADISLDLKDLKKTRDDSLKQAESVFKQATEKARTDLLIGLK
jgi:hypothetical protein